jgi:hypothetical protein
MTASRKLIIPSFGSLRLKQFGIPYSFEVMIYSPIQNGHDVKKVFLPSLIPFPHFAF